MCPCRECVWKLLWIISVCFSMERWNIQKWLWDKFSFQTADVKSPNCCDVISILPLGPVFVFRLDSLKNKRPHDFRGKKVFGDPGAQWLRRGWPQAGGSTEDGQTPNNTSFLPANGGGKHPKTWVTAGPTSWSETSRGQLSESLEDWEGQSCFSKVERKTGVDRARFQSWQLIPSSFCLSPWRLDF